jgi:cobalt/nickel transport system permease protein
MAVAHLTVAGAAEAILAGAVVAYLQRANLPLLRVNHPGIPVDVTAAGAAARRRRRTRPFLLAVLAVEVMVVLTPLGLLAPGGAFGEDAPDRLDLAKLHLSAVPTGLNKFNGFWHHTLFDGYGFGGGAHPWVGYLVSALVGVVVIGLVVFVLALVAERLRGADGVRG